MRLLRLVAVACMVTVGVASLGCGEPAVTEKPAEKSAASSSTESASESSEAAATGTTPVSLAISGMS